MAAGDVVGEDFQFRLVVGFGLIGQQQRPRHHLGVGFLGVGPNDDAALEHRMAAVIDHSAEDFTAGAVRHRMIEKHRGVGMLAAIEQIDAVRLDARALARKADDRLIAAHIRSAGHAECIEMGVGVERDDSRRNVEGLAAVLDQTHMVEPCAVSDRYDKGVMDLIGFGTIRGNIAFHQRRACGPAELEQRAREHRRRLCAACDMDDMQGLGERGAVGDFDHDAIGHHRAVQRHHGIGIVGREQLRLKRAIAGFQYFAQRANAEASFQISRLGQFWREHPVHQHQPARAGDGMPF